MVRRETTDDHIYKGQILKLKKRKKCTFVIAYHSLEEKADEAVDWDITRSAFLTDWICNDVTLI